MIDLLSRWKIRQANAIGKHNTRDLATSMSFNDRKSRTHQSLTLANHWDRTESRYCPLPASR